MSILKLDTFTRQYIETALWSSTDGDGEPLDRNYEIDDFAVTALVKMVADCAQFQAEHADDIASDVSQAGHDFWLTRCGHGCGFWDGDWSEPQATRLTKASRAYGATGLYVDDSGKVRCE